ncbi:HEAT repeat domain-containing protein [Chitinophaga polysaccharea]|uniref:HEAT repeat domain-containing protein n=1 Tax=Chitinophaga TaxID=79328 RepID=UPI001455A2AE|nr:MULTISPECIES: HEAT repeat domain-containing protein [Chitinophaga]NLR58569.1 HEAT repeat domain-containing protein [Chitinophaga polysaccharea]NLU91097.1 HEAT repeat domain-containing protein [Chitinophaga sp. Ak27]
MFDIQLPAFLEPFINIFRSAPLVIQLAMIFIVVAAGGTLLAYFSILRNRYRGNRRDKRLAKLLPKIDNLIIDEVLTHPEADTVPADQVVLNLDAFQELPLDKKWARAALTERIIHFRRNVRGNMGLLLRSLYMQLELDKDAMKKMKAGHWEKKVQALIEFTSMDMSVADVTILPLTNSRNRELRAAARHAYIKLSKNEPFKFFDVVTEPLLMWDQVELLRIISTTEDIAIPNFARWVTYSSNKSVVSFCLKLIVHYNQLPAVPAVIKLLDTKDHYLRADAINCLGKLRVPDVEDKLVSIYSTQPLHCQIEILKALGRISSGRHIEFLKLEFLHSTDFDLRKSAAKSLVRNDWIAKQVIEELMATATPENLRILKHCMNPLIKY